MSQEFLEMIRRGYGAFAAGDREVLFSNLHPEVEWKALQDTEVHQGAAGVRESVSNWSDAWRRWDLEALEFIDGGERIVVLVRERGRTDAAGGIEVEAIHYHVWEVRDAMIVGFREYADREEALAAAAIAR